MNVQVRRRFGDASCLKVMTNSKAVKRQESGDLALDETRKQTLT